MSETVKIKKDISLYVADSYLEGLYCNANNLMQDPEYARRFNDLRQYVNAKLDDGITTDITEMYITVECEPPTIGVNDRCHCCDVATSSRTVQNAGQ